MKELPWTGERLVTTVNTKTTAEHLHRYALAMEYVEGKTVLDIACGEGYGCNLLANKAKEVIGVDISEEVIMHAKNKYQKSNIEFLKGSTSQIPVSNQLVDAIVSFETIEHHDEHNEMMDEFVRVLKEDGILIISSPDKEFYSEKKGYTNPFHVKELYNTEFVALINKYFKHFVLLKQGFCSGSFVYNKDYNSELHFFNGDFDQLERKDGLQTPEYNIIIATNNASAPLNLPCSFFESPLIEAHYEKMLNYYNKELKSILNSESFRVGRLVTAPFRFLKRIIVN